MILHGIMGTVLGGFQCIRGFASLSDLARISKSDEGYQRNLIETHGERIRKFLEDQTYLFFPEVVLSFRKMEDFSFAEVEGALFEQSFTLLYQPYSSTINDSIIDGNEEELIPLIIDFENIPSIKSTTQNPNEIVKIATITINVEDKFFNRIDGNHRLSAADKFKDSSMIPNLRTPFCLILPPNISDDKSIKKFEKTIFHNINFKHIPLTKEEHLKVMLDGETFSDDELIEQFGKEYALARKFLKQHKNYDNLPSLNAIINNHKHEILVEAFKVFADNDEHEITNNELWRAFNRVEAIYDSHSELMTVENFNYGLLVALLYFKLKNEKTLDGFVKWIIGNHIYKITENNANSIIRIYKSLEEKRHKTIFLSMAFGNKESESHYEAIKGVLYEINREFNISIPLREIRMDMFDSGYSYTIADEILKQISECGLLIGDLSFKNVNVYHELGYLMGLNRSENRDDGDFILLMKEKSNNAATNDSIGFNISSYKQIRFEDTEDLRRQLAGAIKEYYNLK